MPEIESLNSRMPLPSERPTSGSFFGPRTISAITRTMSSSGKPMPENTLCRVLLLTAGWGGLTNPLCAGERGRQRIAGQRAPYDGRVLALTGEHLGRGLVEVGVGELHVRALSGVDEVLLDGEPGQGRVLRRAPC